MHMFLPANLTQGQLYLVCGSRHFTGLRMRDLVVEFALQGAVRVLVGGNRFGVHEIAYALAAQTEQYYDILENRISLARAETCYQMAGLLKSTLAAAKPTLVSDFLSPFYEEGMAEKEVDELLFESFAELRRLSQHAPLVLTASVDEKRKRLLLALEKTVDVTERVDAITPASVGSRYGAPSNGARMGHTKIPFTMQYHKERRHFSEFRRALLLHEDQLLFDELWNRSEFHIPAAEKAAHPLPISTILLSMNLEQEKAIAHLEEKIKIQEKEIQRLQEENKQKDRQIVYTNTELDGLQREMERSMKQFREELLELLYPAYAS